MKLRVLRFIKMGLNETCSKYLSDMFPTQNDLNSEMLNFHFFSTLF
jgi:hypothetical protein